MFVSEKRRAQRQRFHVHAVDDKKTDVVKGFKFVAMLNCVLTSDEILKVKGLMLNERENKRHAERPIIRISYRKYFTFD